ncbi:MAG TPA: protein kinase, partial [Actinopolymorphaceae bacterium]
MHGDESARWPDGEVEAPTVAVSGLDGYVLRERVGEGGMGVVHRATDPHGRVVAIKLLHPHVASDSESRARFAREARVLGQVTGPHVAEVIDADVVSETPYLVTRYVHGPSLHDVVRREGPLQGGDLADLAGDLADALRSIHRAGVVHRDLTPANVLLEPTDAGRVAVLVDFGIAQLADETRMTMTGMVYGTPGYVAPEVLSGGDVDPAGDIHAWAATVSFAATGRAPFGSGPLEAVAFRVLQSEPDLDGCPEWLLPVLRRCFAKEPERRPTAAELLHWLETGEEPPERPVATLVFPGGEPLPPARPLGEPEWQRPAGPAEPPSTPAQHAPTMGYAQPGSDGYVPPGAEPVPARAPAYGPSAGHEQVSGLARMAERSRSIRVVGWAFVLALVAVAANAPVVAVGIALAWMVIARTIDRSVRYFSARRSQSGGRRTDGVLATLALPWHALRAGLMTSLTASIAAGGAA